MGGTSQPTLGLRSPDAGGRGAPRVLRAPAPDRVLRVAAVRLPRRPRREALAPRPVGPRARHPARHRRRAPRRRLRRRAVGRAGGRGVDAARRLDVRAARRLHLDHRRRARRHLQQSTSRGSCCSSWRARRSSRRTGCVRCSRPAPPRSRGPPSWPSSRSSSRAPRAVARARRRRLRVRLALHRRRPRAVHRRQPRAVARAAAGPRGAAPRQLPPQDAHRHGRQR